MIILNEDIIALKYIAVYYGLPRYGHERCFLNRNRGRTLSPVDDTRVEQVTRFERDIESMRCIQCGKLLLPKEASYV